MTNKRNSPFIKRKDERLKEVRGQASVYPLLLGPTYFAILVDANQGTASEYVPPVFVPPTVPVAPGYENVISYWSLDNADLGSVNDVMGKNDATNVNALTGEAGQVYEAFNFDGFSSYILVPNDISLESHAGTNGTMSFSGWINVANAGDSQDIITKYETSGDERAWGFGLIPGGQLRFLATDPTITNYDSKVSTPIISPGTWHHVGFTWDNSQITIENKVKIYVDGYEVDGYQDINAGTFVQTSGTSGDVLIGAFNPSSPGNFFDGYMDELILFNNVVSNNEMLQLYLDGLAGNRFVETLPDPGSYWSLDNLDLSGTTVLDVVGTNDGTESGTTTGALGIINESFIFDGVASEITISDDISLDPELQDYAGACWFKSDIVPASAEMLISKRGGGGAYDNFVFYVSGAGRLTIECSDDISGSPFDLTNNPNSIVAGVWYHGFFRIDRANSFVELFQDGEFISRTALTIGNLSNAIPLQIGFEGTGGHWDGNIDEVAIWKGAIPDGYVASKILYNYGLPNIPSPVGYWTMDNAQISGTTCQDKMRRHDATIQVEANGPTTGVAGQIGEAYDFDGSSVAGYVTVAHDADLHPVNFSISFWLQMNSAPVQYDMIICKTTDANWLDGWGLFWNSATQINFFMGQWNVSPALATGLTATNWNHVVGTWDGTNTRIYLNGVLSGTNGGSRITNTANLEMARGTVFTYNIDGKLDDVQLYSTTLDARQVAYLYAEGAKGRTLL